MKLKAPNGDIIEVQEGEKPAEAIARWKQGIYEKVGYDPNFKMKSGDQAAAEAGEKWIEDNPVAGQAAAFQAGARNLGRNLLQMALPQSMEARFGVTDEDQFAAQAAEAPLKDRNRAAYLAGEVIPTMAVPLGGGGAAVSRLAGRLGARNAGRVLTQAAPGLARAAGEGALYGAATAGPDERTAGALLGGVGGAAGNVLARSLGRLGSGAVPSSATGNRVEQVLRQTPGMDANVRVPASLGKDQGLARGAYKAVTGIFPGGRKRIAAQTGALAEGAYEAVLRQSFGKHGDDVVQVFRESGGNFDDAFSYGQKLLGNSRLGNFTAPQRSVLKHAIERTTRGDLPSFEQIYASSKRLFPTTPTTQAPFRQLAGDMRELLGKQDSTISPLVERAAFYAAVRKLGGAVPAANMFAGFLALPQVQTVLKGNTRLQTQLLKAIESGRESLVTPMLGRVARAAGIATTIGEAGDLYDQGKLKLEEFTDE